MSGAKTLSETLPNPQSAASSPVRYGGDSNMSKGQDMYLIDFSFLDFPSLSSASMACTSSLSTLSTTISGGPSSDVDNACDEEDGVLKTNGRYIPLFAIFLGTSASVSLETASKTRRKT